MKRTLVFGVAMMLAASSAMAYGGIDLTIGGCPGEAGAIGQQAGDPGCGTDPTIILLATWAPAEAIPDLVGLDGLIDIQVLPDLDAINFWNVTAGGCGRGLGG